MANGKRGRKKSTDEVFYLTVTEDILVTKDTYNIIVSRKVRGDAGEFLREQHQGYFCRMQFIPGFLEDIGVDKQAVQKFQERTSQMTVHHIDGKVIIDAPKGFVFDERKVPATSAVTA